MFDDYEPNENLPEAEYAGDVPSTPVKPAPVYETPKKAEKRGISTGGIIALALCCSLIGGSIGFFASQAVTDRREKAEPEYDLENYVSAILPTPTPEADNAEVFEGKQEPGILDTASENTGALMTAAQVYAANVGSTVGINASITYNSWGYQSTYPASGSGFIMTEDGYILTNYHVIEGSSSVTVTTFDNDIYDAKIIGYDAGNDVAVLKIDAKGLTPVTLGSSDALHVGDPVVAIGNPLGELTFSLTQGVVSALNREVTLSSNSTMDLIQTDTAINSGNSGGALFNLYGEVVGITNAKYSSGTGSSSASIDNIGFAIPIDHVRGIVESIIQYGYIVKPYIGVSVSTVGSEMISYGFPKGALIKVVNDDSPSSAAGLLVNDIITAVNGDEITSSSDLVRIVSRCPPGETITLTVYRQSDTTVDIKVVVGEQQLSALEEQEQNQQQMQQQQQPYDQFPFFGFDFGNWG